MDKDKGSGDHIKGDSGGNVATKDTPLIQTPVKFDKPQHPPSPTDHNQQSQGKN